MTADYTELKAKAEAANGWMGNAVIKEANPDEDQMCEIGGVNADFPDDFNSFITLDCENYGADSKPLAEYIVSSPDGVLALIARVAELEKDAARYQQILRTTRGDFDKMVRLAGMSQAHGGKPLHESLDEAIKAAKEQPCKT